MRDSIRKFSAVWDTCFIGLAVLTFHLWNVPAVAGGAIFRKSNLAFDFDIDRFTTLWCKFPFQVSQNEDYYAVRHPLAVLVRVACRPVVWAGLEPHIAACGIAAVCAALSSMLAFRIALAMGVGRWLACLFTGLWATSTTSILLGVLPESYDLALIALSYQLLISIRWIQGRQPALAERVVAAVANFGITITNVMFSALTEFICRLARQPARKAIRGTVGIGALVAVIALLLSAASFSLWPVKGIDSSIRAIKQVYWSAASAEKTSTRQPVGDVAWTFAATSFVAPALARYPSGVEDNPYLWDLRGQRYSPVGWVAVVGWLGLLLFGVVAAAGDRQLRPIWLITMAWIAGNIALHSYWQFRDSVFLYSANSHISFFVVALAGARWVQGRGKTSVIAYSAFVVLLALMITNNMPEYLALSQLN